MSTLDTLIVQYRAAEADWHAKHTAWRTAPRRKRAAETDAMQTADKAMRAASRALLVATGHDMDRWQELIGVRA
jgi:hypothetical protein